MKKLSLLALFVTFSFSITACSDTDVSDIRNRPSGNLVMMVDGVQKQYNDIKMTEIIEEDGDVRLDISCTQNGKPGEYIKFRTYKYRTGTGRTSTWFYSDDSNAFRREIVDGEEYDIESNITTNNNNRLRGTFSGTLYNTYSKIAIEITEGELNYNYNLPESN